eukprot:gene45544-61703_t
MIASSRIRRDPAPARALVAATAGFRAEDVARSWPTLAFPAALTGDLLDVLTEEEQWLATQDGRVPRSRDTLSRLIDTSVYREYQRGFDLGCQPVLSAINNRRSLIRNGLRDIETRRRAEAWRGWETIGQAFLHCGGRNGTIAGPTIARRGEADMALFMNHRSASWLHGLM